MAYAEKRDDKLTGYWYGKVVIEGGKRFRKRFASKKDAEAYETFTRMMGREPPMSEGGQSGRTFAEVAEEAKRAGGPRGVWKLGRDPSNLRRVEYVISRLGGYDIADVNRQALEKLVVDLQSRPANGKKHKLSPATINRYLTAVFAILSYAVACEYITHKPKFPMLKESGERQATLTFEQEDAVVRLMEINGHATGAFLVRVLAATGMRLGELYKLRPDQIENEWLSLERVQTKTNEARRVWIEPNMASKLRALVASGALPKADQLRSTFSRAVKQCGLDKGVVLHSLRHTRATRLAKAGVETKIRMVMLGHKTVSTAMRYTHASEDDQLEAAKKVEQSRGLLPQKSEVVPFVHAKSA